MEKLLVYLNDLSKEGRVRFVGACGTSESYLRKAISKGQLLGSSLCVAIERESLGKVTRQDLHPDDWSSHWPELKSMPTALIPDAGHQPYAGRLNGPQR